MITPESILRMAKEVASENLWSHPMVFVYFEINSGWCWWNTCPQDTSEILHPLISSGVIKYDGIFTRYGTLHLRYKFTEIKYPKFFKRTVSDSLRKLVLNRDGNKCTNCGSESNLEIDHIEPFSKEGWTMEPNLQTLCKKCNCSKSNKNI